MFEERDSVTMGVMMAALEPVGVTAKVRKWGEDDGRTRYRIRFQRGMAQVDVFQAPLEWDYRPTPEDGLRYLAGAAHYASSGYEHFCSATELDPLSQKAKAAFTSAAVEAEWLRWLIGDDALYAKIVFEV
jgi:hypothetical protein